MYFWLIYEKNIMDDGIHLNPEGHTLYAEIISQSFGS